MGDALSVPFIVSCLIVFVFVFRMFFTYRHYWLGYLFPMYITKENEGNAEKYRKGNIKLLNELRMIWYRENNID